LDLAVTAGSYTVSVLPGKGDGTFDRPSPFSAGSNPQGITVRDFNNDGRLDVAAGLIPLQEETLC
jgi:hypothetical protein